MVETIPECKTMVRRKSRFVVVEAGIEAGGWKPDAR